MSMALKAKLYYNFYHVQPASTATNFKSFILVNLGCPKDCRPDQVCVTPGFAEPYCGCPPGKEEIDGKCVHCPSKVITLFG